MTKTNQPNTESDAEKTDNRRDIAAISHQGPAPGTGSMEAAIKRQSNPIKRVLTVLGPGLVTGASDDDPSGIGTYATAGASPLAVPILTGSSAYAVAEAFRWKFGLDKKPRRAKQFYAMIVGPTIVGMLIDFAGINPIRALFWTAVINGFLAPPLLVMLMLIANNKEIMGGRVNGLWSNLLGWLTTVAMFAAAAGLVLVWGS